MNTHKQHLVKLLGNRNATAWAIQQRARLAGVKVRAVPQQGSKAAWRAGP